ncbi:hypothetical protein TCAL_02099 [Tigriopus californicus]|uniref:T-complex protein 1 subunit delta n=1 Tax=Tigriopus californicus TaxID=6832 RepID=A0A553NDS8_TIGCA|nr:hypothetical protein TCAL_02099 [Tigriopus californicus]
MGVPKQSGNRPSGLMSSKNQKPIEIRSSNIRAGKALADAVRTSLGPRGMDKMIQGPKGDVTITNDGATILEQMKVMHPSAKMLVNLSKAQDVEAGDGTTSVVVMAGSLLEAAEKLLKKGIHPTTISEAFQKAAVKSVEILTEMAVPVDLSDREKLMQAANTSLNSKVVSQHSSELSPIAVDAVLKVINPNQANNVDLNDIKVIKKLGGTVDDTELVEGLVLNEKASGNVKKVEKAKIGLIQFQVSPPKTDMDNQVIVSDYAAMDRVLREERAYILNIVKQIKKAGCNVLLIQNCRPIASLDHFTAENLVAADLVEEQMSGPSKFVKVTGIAHQGRTVSVIMRGSNKLVLEEADRSLHDALCVIRCLVKKKFLIAGGGAPAETELYLKLTDYANTLIGADSYCFKAYAEALEVVPYTLAENAGLNPIATVTELRNRHALGETMSGINVRKGAITNILDENVVQPLLVSTSAINLASETVRSILKIDDIVNTVS